MLSGNQNSHKGRLIRNQKPPGGLFGKILEKFVSIEVQFEWNVDAFTANFTHEVKKKRSGSTQVIGNVKVQQQQGILL